MRRPSSYLSKFARERIHHAARSVREPLLSDDDLRALSAEVDKIACMASAMGCCSVETEIENGDSYEYACWTSGVEGSRQSQLRSCHIKCTFIFESGHRIWQHPVVTQRLGDLSTSLAARGMDMMMSVASG